MLAGDCIVEKILSANDCGTTGGHQAGTLIPKDEKILGFFPELDCSVKNPRRVIYFVDDAGERHRFCFIYYNSRVLGCGTRNEFRLTCMTEYIRSCNLKEGDSLLFSRKDGIYYVGYKRKDQNEASQEGVILVMSGKWKVVQI